MENKEFCKEIVKQLIKEKITDLDGFIKIRRKLAREVRPNIFPSIIQVLACATEKEFEKLKFLTTKPMRTIAGVAPVAIMTKATKCPHGKCIMCPGGLDSAYGNTPQSYTGKEPAAMRAFRNKYDSYLQVMNRLEQYTLLNQSTDKVELILMGGTFIALDKEYKEDFVKFAFKAMNDFSEMFFIPEFNFGKFKEFFELPADVSDKERTKRIQDKMLALKKDCSLEEEQKKNETSNVRCVALCVETRPDYCKKEHIDEMLRLGCTRVEIGVQSIYDDVLKNIERGHLVKDSIEATQLLRDSFLKVGYHIMPGLLGSTKEKDIGMFKKLFSNPDFKPDMLKIYPCMVTKGTKLYEQWQDKKFVPLTTEDASEIIIKGKKFVDVYCRIMRVQRDIPSKEIIAGVDITNLRQKIMEVSGVECNCLRCREPKGKMDFSKVEMKRYDYEASNGKEVFLTIEQDKQLLGFCRLRVPYKPFREEITDNVVGIRQIHVYTTSTKIGENPSGLQAQHRGFGKQLMKEAERIAKEEFNASKILVLSGIGVKEYFRKLGYSDVGVYLEKEL
ncbi:MAG: tRNA uridine(34) 5-carboxymethylaminomethyl modification radical SAM/GNAT enzyme Elp3 [Nanoarchaeota archaeon]|nr:tRNA uridine(34) 5-carboxymethylaminomethyl modification radical SAM/GNAT enzyme Elp3 [Nanoarchaeota archaeon]MBU4242211.1 tRNA uridine(34) 5-carboxymethylaminomethyl modification radical SAM/GNAT enzyme Elp3 [Nanoarchaeota archaeon]MBU4352049.1 tRNA uridine(34) 5-carboxymethylaminomethyl modification radical SAM/GNAT enzyme Elp3 [Nanoarchaeota archaeon]MBU4455904.1 tRNA uridine(34) 5-carboxymethylaminomethyl modification radical SAM/GNAT enzyme Elp3 [Nanoarchaeota archaeon]